MADILATMQTEISKLERELANDPRFKKLTHLKELITLYQNGDDENDSPNTLASKTPAKRGRQPNPEREKMCAEIDRFLQGKTVPIRTAEIFNHLVSIGVSIPGTDPRNNLSAIIFNSGRYESHGRQGWTLPIRERSPPQPVGVVYRQSHDEGEE